MTRSPSLGDRYNDKNKDEIQGSLHCATDDKTVRCSGRDDVCLGWAGGWGGREQATAKTAISVIRRHNLTLPGLRLRLLGIGGEVFGWAAPVALAEADAGVGVVGNPDVDGVHSGGRIAAALGRGLEAEQVVVVDVVGELVEAVVEALLGGEVDVLASGERGQFVGGVLLEGVHRHDQ